MITYFKLSFVNTKTKLESYGIKPYGFKVEKVNGCKKPLFPKGFHLFKSIPGILYKKFPKSKSFIIG